MQRILNGVLVIVIALTAVMCKGDTDVSVDGTIDAPELRPLPRASAREPNALFIDRDEGLQPRNISHRAACDLYCQPLQSQLRRARREKKPLKPRNGHTLVVGIIARISGCANQKELSLDDQVDHAKEEVAELYDGEVEYRIIKTKGKGERLDRPELVEVERMLRSRELDLLVAEDLGRIVRGTAAKDLCAIAVDHGTRVIVPNDAIDTDDPDWEVDVIGACQEHVGHNSHTSKRLKHKLLNRFRKLGGAMAREIAGYIVPDDAKTYHDWRKDDDAAPILLEGFRILRETLNGAAVADYFNSVVFKGAVGFPTGPYCRTTKSWTGVLALRYYRNTMLSGRPGRGFRRTIKHHESGRRISVRNPDGPIYQDFEHLRFLDPAAQDELIRLLATKNGIYRRAQTPEADPRLRVPRKRTRWPGQTGSSCWVCGRNMQWGANGTIGSLMCSGARNWKCWNSIGFDGALAVERIVAAIETALFNLNGFDVQLRELVQKSASVGDEQLESRRRQLDQDERALEVQCRNAKAAVLRFGDDPMVAEALAAVDTETRRIAAERYRLSSIAGRKLELPSSIDELRSLFRSAFAGCVADSPEFSDVLRRIVPEFHVYLVRMIDGGPLLPRARAVIAFDGLVPDAVRVPELHQILTQTVTLDLFHTPVRERIRRTAVELHAGGATIPEIARDQKVAIDTVKQALALDRRLSDAGLADPFTFVNAPPDDLKKLRRHRNPRYRFEPRDGYVAPALNE